MALRTLQKVTSLVLKQNNDVYLLLKLLLTEQLNITFSSILEHRNKHTTK